MIGRRLVRDSEQQTAFDHLIIGWAGCFSRIGLADGDVGEAVETLAFLVAVKGGAGGGDGPAAELISLENIESAVVLVVLDVEQVDGDLLVPGGLDEAPARLGLEGQITGMRHVEKLIKLIREDQAARPSTALGEEESFREFGLVDDVKSIDDIVEAETGGGLQKLIVRDAAVVIGDAGVEEFATGAGHLLG